jgi:hypothetical protein
MSFIWLFCNLSQVGVAAPFLASALPAILVLLRDMAHSDGRDKHPQSEGSSHGSRSPPPRRMTMVAGSHWVSMVNR